MGSTQDRLQSAALRLFAQRGATQLTISELADAAGVARGTVYNNVASLGSLFADVARRLAEEMHARVVASYADKDDPAVRVANGIRFFVRRAHEEPHWGRFINRFAFSDPALQALWNGPPMEEVMNGAARGRFELRPDQVQSVIALIAGTVLAAMFLVLEGHRTWRDAGADAAELVLRALGLRREEARALSMAELPPLRAVGAR
ncbi:MAG: TetR/AcrR family transcriptional regulator [Polyangiaceae bacterium]|nr:TetR/AcrR family transcriptional regulator [Polyangiaceae bacterium]